MPVCRPMRTRIGPARERGWSSPTRRSAPGGRGEGEEERVALGVDLDAAVAANASRSTRRCSASACVVGLGAELVQQPRRALDVGEEEGDRAGGEVVTHRRQSCAKSNT